MRTKSPTTTRAFWYGDSANSCANRIASMQCLRAKKRVCSNPWDLCTNSKAFSTSPGSWNRLIIIGFNSGYYNKNTPVISQSQPCTSTQWPNQNPFPRKLTFSQAKRTGAVASPNLRSAAVGFPIVSAVDTKSSKSSTNWNANPIFLPYWKAISEIFSSALANRATYRHQNNLNL